ncbi:MAG: hypothetical protein ACREBW_05995 [Candidatus Micrarchaeaceae archaeon]
MSGLITIRIPEALQAQMKKYKINWSDKIRMYLEAQVRQLELSNFLSRNSSAMKHAKMHADSTPLIKEDRETR